MKGAMKGEFSSRKRKCQWSAARRTEKRSRGNSWAEEGGGPVRENLSCVRTGEGNRRKKHADSTSRVLVIGS